MKLRFTIFLWLSLCFTLNPLQASDDLTPLLQQATDSLEIDLEVAESKIEEALALAPNNPKVNFLCGRIMGKQAQNAIFTALKYANKSLTCFKRAVKYAPKEIDYRVGLLKFYLGAPSIAGGDKALALQQVNAIYQIDLEQGAVAEIILLRDQEKDEVLKAKLITWTKQYPTNSEFHFRLGMIYQNEGNFEAAYMAFKQGAANQKQTIHYLNSLYQLGRNAVFSHSFVQEGIDSLIVFIEESNKDANVPSNHWAALRLAQLFSLNENDEMKVKYSNLAAKSEDRELHRLLKKI